MQDKPQEPTAIPILPHLQKKQDAKAELVASEQVVQQHDPGKRVFYYGGGLFCVFQGFLSIPMMIVGMVYMYDCPIAPFIPQALFCAGAIHFLYSLPFTGLVLYAIIRLTIHNTRKARISNILSPVARSAANAFFSSFIGYTMDVISLFTMIMFVSWTLVLYKRIGNAKFKEKLLMARKMEPGECDLSLVYFTYACMAAYILFFSLVFVLVVIGCCRKDQGRHHHIFAENVKHACEDATGLETDTDVGVRCSTTLLTRRLS